MGHNSLTALPSAVRHLSSLTALAFPSNRVATLPAQLAGLARLTALDASNNRIEFLPPVLATLPALASLRLADNRIFSLPFAVSSMPALHSLSLARNPLPASLLNLAGGANGSKGDRSDADLVQGAALAAVQSLMARARTVSAAMGRTSGEEGCADAAEILGWLFREQSACDCWVQPWGAGGAGGRGASADPRGAVSRAGAHDSQQSSSRATRVATASATAARAGEGTGLACGGGGGARTDAGAHAVVGVHGQRKGRPGGAGARGARRAVPPGGGGGLPRMARAGMTGSPHSTGTSSRH